MRFLGRHVERVDGRAVTLAFAHRHHLAAKFLPQPAVDVRRQLHSLGSHRHDRGAESRQRIDKGMDRSRSSEVAGDRDLQISQALVFLPEQEQIAQRLRRVLVAAVAAVDHRDRRILGRKPRRAIARVTDDHEVRIIRDHPDGIGEALALGGRACCRIGTGDGLAAEPDHRAFERQPRTGARFIEQVEQSLAVQAPFEKAIWCLLQVSRGREQDVLGIAAHAGRLGSTAVMASLDSATRARLLDLAQRSAVA